MPLQGPSDEELRRQMNTTMGQDTHPRTPLGRRGWVIALQPGARDEYRRLHQDVWPGVQRRLLDAGIASYSIYMHGDLLFSYMEFRGSFDDVQSFIELDEETQRWWKLTEPLQRPLESAVAGECWTSMEEVFHVNSPATTKWSEHDTK